MCLSDYKRMFQGVYGIWPSDRPVAMPDGLRVLLVFLFLSARSRLTGMNFAAECLYICIKSFFASNIKRSLSEAVG